MPAVKTIDRPGTIRRWLIVLMLPLGCSTHPGKSEPPSASAPSAQSSRPAAHDADQDKPPQPPSEEERVREARESGLLDEVQRANSSAPPGGPDPVFSDDEAAGEAAFEADRELEAQERERWEAIQESAAKTADPSPGTGDLGK